MHIHRGGAAGLKQARWLAPGEDGFSLTFTDELASESDADSYTFNDVDFGDAAADRLIAIGTGVRISTDPTSQTIAATLGGVGATQLVFSAGSQGGVNFLVGSYHSAVPTGATGTVVVDQSAAGGLWCGVAVYRLTGASSTVSDTAITSASDDQSLVSEITIPAGGGGIGYAVMDGGVGWGIDANYAWSGQGYARDFTGTIQANTDAFHSSAHSTTAGTDNVTSDAQGNVVVGGFFHLLVSWATA